MRELLKQQMHSAKREFIGTVPEQLRRYSLLANQPKYMEAAPKVNFHKRLLLESALTSSTIAAP